MKKVLAIFLMLCMLSGICTVVFADSGNPTSFHIVTEHQGGTFYTYDDDGNKVKVEVGEDALIVNVVMENCEENNVYSGIIELFYDDTMMTCFGARSYTGGLWAANTRLEGKVRLVFSTGTDVTEDGIILSVAFGYLKEPEEGDETEFTLNVEQLCSDKTGDDKYVDYDVPEGEEYTYVYEEPEEPVTYLYGDANGDDKINTADAVVILKYSAEMMALDETQIIRANVNFDDKVNTGDAVLILKYCVGIVTEFVQP